jgi:hypothetical protein
MRTLSRKPLTNSEGSGKMSFDRFVFGLGSIFSAVSVSPHPRLTRPGRTLNRDSSALKRDAYWVGRDVQYSYAELKKDLQAKADDYRATGTGRW